MEKEGSEWRLQGQPTVLLTLTHIFQHFAPLLVRGIWGKAGHSEAVPEAGMWSHLGSSPPLGGPL